MDDYELRTAIRQCEKCSLKEYPHVPGKGNLNPDILIVGEAPGSREAELMIPFVGYAGSFLHLVLAELEFPKDSYYITNAVKCRPPGNQTPSHQHIDPCREWLYKELELLNPKIIIPMGITATISILDIPNCIISRYRGLKFKVGKYIVFPTYHPSAILRDTAKKEIFYSDFRNVKNFLEKDR